MRATEKRVDPHPQYAPLEPGSAAHQVACRLFPGFADVPTPVRVSLERYAALFDPGTGPLALDYRAAIAAAVAEVVAGAALDRDLPFAISSRATLLARFAVKLLSRSFAVDALELEQLKRAGLDHAEIAAAAETAIGYHVVARLAAAARGQRPPLCAQLTTAARRNAFAA